MENPKIIGQIEFTEQVIFRDMHGTIRKVYEIGDRIGYYCISRTNTHYITTGFGDIELGEAKIVTDVA